jgi:Amino acid synthesis
MTIRKPVTLVEEINSEYGAPASPPLRRVAIAAVFGNPSAGKAAGPDRARRFPHEDGTLVESFASGS